MLIELPCRFITSFSILLINQVHHLACYTKPLTDFCQCVLSRIEQGDYLFVSVFLVCYVHMSPPPRLADECHVRLMLQSLSLLLIQMSGLLDWWISGFLDIQISGLLAFWIAGLRDIQGGIGDETPDPREA
jgi:hypothetical protein